MKLTNLKPTLHTQINHNPALIAATDIIEAILCHDETAFLVGGGVRDMLLGRQPGDVDIATSARPDQLQLWFPGSTLVGAKFGVVIVPRNGINVEVATFREEGEYNDRRRPDLVRFSDLENDGRRRDFTCNAIYYDPVNDSIIDQVGGVADIAFRLLRTVGNPVDRFSEDALRVLRAVRFAAYLDFELHPDTWAAIKKCAKFLSAISMERVRDEILKGFCGGSPDRFLDLLDQAGVLNLFLPEVLKLKGCEQPPEFHPEGDVYIHTRMMLRFLKPNPSPCLAMSVLLHDIAKPVTQTFGDRIRFNGHDKVGADMAAEICQRMKMSNSQIGCIESLVRRHMQFINVPTMRKSTLHRFLSSDFIADELELHRVDCLASHDNLSTYEYTVKALETMLAEQPDGKLPNPLISGKDLIANGLTPSPFFALILKQTFDAQLDGQLNSREEALHFALEIATSSGSVDNG